MLRTTNRYFQKNISQSKRGHETLRAYDTFRSWKLRLLFLEFTRMAAARRPQILL
jgi:hypothetical protein